MNPIIQEYTVDLASNNNFLFVPAIQGDGHSTRYVDVTILENQKVYKINADEVVPVIRGIKPDTTQILNECEVVNENVVRFEITNQMTAVPGIGNYEISLYSRTQNSALTSFPFNISVKKAAIDPSAIVSSNEFTYLQEAILKVEEIDSNIIEAEAIRKQNEDARIEAELERANAESSRVNAENARVSAENQRVQNENERVAAEIVREQSENNRNTKETERQANEEVRKSNETTRQENESIRKTNETTRIANEESRIATHNQQISDFNNAKTNAESATRRANTAAQNAEDATVECVQRTNESVAATRSCADLVGDVTRKLNNGEFNGRDGFVLGLQANNYMFQIIEDNLCLVYDDTDTSSIPDFEIVDGNLMVNFG